LRSRCPIIRQIKLLQEMGALEPSQLEAMEREAADRVAEAIVFADASPYPDASEVLDHVD
jgi:TPP-dependent pyruvate/acetoin dehydrogenase alpha subunit